MLHRLIRRLTLTILIGAVLLIGVSLVLGSAFPQDVQFLWQLPRENRWQVIAKSAPFPINSALYSYFHPTGKQWSTVGLYSTDRRLSATRQLPINRINAQWDKTGRFAIITGNRNGSDRAYQMSFTRDDSQIHWLPTTVFQPVSPDQRWVLDYQRDDVGQITGLKAVAIDELDFSSIQRNVEIQIPNRWGYITWAEDSSYFIYVWVLGETNPQLNAIPHLETRLHDVATGEEEILRQNDPRIGGGNFNPVNGFQLQLASKPQPLPASLMTDYSLRYNSELYNYITGETIFLSDQTVDYLNWSQDGRYVLFSVYSPSLLERTRRVLFPDASRKLYWHVYYEPTSSTLIPIEADTPYAPYYGGFYSGYGIPYGMRSLSSTTYLFDLETREKREIASSTQYGTDYQVQWLFDDVLSITKYNPPRQYILSVSGEPDAKLLQYEGKNLIANYGGSRTVAASVEPPASQITSSITSVGAIPFMAPTAIPGPFFGVPPSPGQFYTTPTYYFVDFERDVIAPLTLEKDEVFSEVYSHLYTAGIDVGVMITTVGNNSTSGTFNTTPETNVYLLTAQGVIKVADRLKDIFVQAFPIAKDEFVLLFAKYPGQAAVYSQTSEMAHFTDYDGDGIWQQRNVTGNFTGLIGWRPRQTDRVNYDQTLQ
jgi:hypothetical protein